MVELTTKSTEFKPENPEGSVEQLVHGMRSLDFKQIVVDFQSTKQTWDTLKVPKELQDGLSLMAYKRPSII